MSDRDFSITLDTYFNVMWKDQRLLTNMDYSLADEVKLQPDSGKTASKLFQCSGNYFNVMWKDQRLLTNMDYSLADEVKLQSD